MASVTFPVGCLIRNNGTNRNYFTVHKTFFECCCLPVRVYGYKSSHAARKPPKNACNTFQKIVYYFRQAREIDDLEHFSEFGVLISPAEFEESIRVLTEV
jgi:hypothetical protein